MFRGGSLLQKPLFAVVNTCFYSPNFAFFDKSPSYHTTYNSPQSTNHYTKNHRFYDFQLLCLKTLSITSISQILERLLEEIDKKLVEEVNV